MKKVAAVLSAATILLGGCTSEARPQQTSADGSPATERTPEEPVASATDVGTIEMAAVGDSITAADSPDLAGGSPGSRSWVSYAVGDGVDLVGGWAVWGATTAEMARSAPRVNADVLVILAGTNDAVVTEHDQIAANIVAITEAVGVESVVLSSIPPLDVAPEAARSLNDSLQELADEQGWTWVDSAAGVRDGDRFAAGMASDGVHPTQAGARIIGEAMREAVLDAAGR